MPSSSTSRMLVAKRPCAAWQGAFLLAACVALGACSDRPRPTTEPAQAATEQAPQTGVAPAPSAAPSGHESPAAAPAPGRVVAVNAQAVSPLGLTVRVKQIELAADATVLTVSVSLGGDKTIFTSLADSSTYLRDEAGNKILIQAPADNPHLRVRKGETLEGQLVFLGELPADTRQVEWVINEGNAPDNDSGPGLTLQLPIGAA